MNMKRIILVLIPFVIACNPYCQKDRLPEVQPLNSVTEILGDSVCRALFTWKKAEICRIRTEEDSVT